MPRALWKGAISFGLVNIPVELHAAEDRKSFDFSMLDKRDLSPVGYKRYSKKTGKEVAWADIVKGYEYEKDRYVVLSDEDFRRANVKASQTIEILGFVGERDIPFEYFDTPYYLAPGTRAQKVYALLRETLRSTQRIAVAQVVIRTVQHLAAVVVHGRALMLNTLRYQDELKDPSGIELPAEGLKAAGVSAKEVDLARQLVDGMTQRWAPESFKDSYHDDLMKRIKEKIKLGQTREITQPEKGGEGKPRTAQVIDLMDLLKQSLDKSGGRKQAKRAEGEGASKPKLRVVPRPAAAKRALHADKARGTQRKRA